eukprot:12934498-Prorocentrum_lima.AAC.1
MSARFISLSPYPSWSSTTYGVDLLVGQSDLTHIGCPSGSLTEIHCLIVDSILLASGRDNG